MYIKERYNYNVLAVDYGEYFKLTVDFYFDCGHHLGVQTVVESVHPLAHVKTLPECQGALCCFTALYAKIN